LVNKLIDIHTAFLVSYKKYIYKKKQQACTLDVECRPFSMDISYLLGKNMNATSKIVIAI